jgi:hypothetical protein
MSAAFKRDKYIILLQYIMIPSKYIGPLSRKDKKIQRNMILRSRRLYAKGQYFTRKPLASYKNKTSKHILKAERIYGVKIAPTKELAAKTGCPVSALKAVVRKGQGAYYSSGSRPNQTAQSWGLARLASAITGGKAAKVDYHIIKECHKLAKK